MNQATQQAQTEPKTPAKMAITKEQRAHYQSIDVKTFGGKAKRITNGHPVSVALGNVESLDALFAVAQENGVDATVYTPAARAKDGKAPLNNGQIRMNIGNRLMAMHKRGEPVRINGKTLHDKEAAAAQKAKEAEKAAKAKAKLEALAAAKAAKANAAKQ